MENNSPKDIAELVASSNVANMTGNRQLLNNQFAEMNRTAGSMAANLHERSKPIKIMPFSMQPLA